MINSAFRTFGSTDTTTAPILTTLKSVGASTIYGSTTFLNDNGTNTAHNVFRIIFSGQTVTSSKVKRLQGANYKILDVVADTGNKTFALINTSRE